MRGHSSPGGTTSATAKPDNLIPDRDELVRFLGTMFKNARRDGFVSFRVFEDNGKGEKAVLRPAYRLDDHELVDLMMITAAQAATWWKPAVFCPPVCTFKNHLNAKTDNIREGVGVSAECDASPAAARATLEAVLGPATVVVESGGEWTDPETGEIEPKLHLHWRLQKPAATPEELAALYEARSLATRLAGGDRTNISIVHPIRWPGSWHRKRTPKLARIVSLAESTEIDLSDALERLRAEAGVIEPTNFYNVSGRREASEHGMVAAALAVIPNGDPRIHDWEYWNWTGMTIWASTDGCEEGRMAFHEWSAKSKRYDPATTEARWQHYFRSPPTKLGFGSLVYRARQHVPEWRYEDPRSALATAAIGEFIAQTLRENDEDVEDDEKDENEAGGAAAAAGTPPTELPVIRLGPLSVMADQAAEALLESKVPFYQRGNRLVRPVIMPVQSFGGTSTTVAQLVDLDIHYLRDTLCRKSRWKKFDKKEKKWLPTHPSTDAAQVLLKKFGDWKFPIIAGIISTPTMRPDGSILMEPGYDPATQLLLTDPPPMPEILDNPTRTDALAALQLLKGLLVEFPFADDVSRSVALSAMVSTVCRGAYPVQPMHVIDAPTAGSGKSYLLSIVSRIATGQAMPVLGTGKSEEELEKRLGAAVIHGQSLICIDNVVGELGGDALCRLIEQPRPSVRILGQSQNVEIDARSTSYFGNGNNVVIVGDLCRRVIRSRLDSQTERPELRTFKADPEDMILADRGAYIAACLTICRAYIVAGSPKRRPRLASFGEWSDRVRSALVWLGEADPVESMDVSRAEDPETDALLTMLTEWKALFGTGRVNGMSVREVINRCDVNVPVYMGKNYINTGLRNAVLSVMPVKHNLKPDATARGHWLRSRKDWRAGGMWFNKEDETGHSPTLWWVEEADRS